MEPILQQPRWSSRALIIPLLFCFICEQNSTSVLHCSLNKICYVFHGLHIHNVTQFLSTFLDSSHSISKLNHYSLATSASFSSQWTTQLFPTYRTLQLSFSYVDLFSHSSSWVSCILSFQMWTKCSSLEEFHDTLVLLKYSLWGTLLIVHELIFLMEHCIINNNIKYLTHWNVSCMKIGDIFVICTALK